MPEEITCPFCGDEGFDLIGLKDHFEKGHCEEYNETMTPEEEAILREEERNFQSLDGSVGTGLEEFDED